MEMFFFLRDYMKQEVSETNKKIVTLQVRISLIYKKNCGKRTFPSASPNRTGSLTVEAAFVFPLFLFAMVTLMMPFSMMNRQRQMQAVVESVCEDLCRLAYAGYEWKEQKTEIRLPEEGLEIPVDSLETGSMWAYAELNVRTKACAGVRKLSLKGSKILEDGETVYLEASYIMEFPFPVLGVNGIMMTSSSCRRAWIGKDGGWLDTEAGKGGDDDETVYIGKTSTRYHKSRTCHYLYNQLSSVLLSEIDSQRNIDGKKYYPCASCKTGIGERVYIMPSGTSYHSSASCGAIIAYVKAVKKSEVEHLGACSYCSGG